MNAENKAALILAAGLGTRLGHLTKNRPKALLEVEGHSLLEINLRKLEKQGFNYIVVNTHHFHDQIESFIRNFDSTMIIKLSHEQEEPLETGGGLLNALHLFEGHKYVLVHNVDVITDLSINELFEPLSKSDAAAVLAVSERSSSRRLLFDSKNRLAGWTNTDGGSAKCAREKSSLRLRIFGCFISEHRSFSGLCGKASFTCRATAPACRKT